MESKQGYDPDHAKSDTGIGLLTNSRPSKRVSRFLCRNRQGAPEPPLSLLNWKWVVAVWFPAPLAGNSSRRSCSALLSHIQHQARFAIQNCSPSREERQSVILWRNTVFRDSPSALWVEARGTSVSRREERLLHKAWRWKGPRAPKGLCLCP